ncbi:MAG: flagellar hook protein FlgE [Acidobacteria bacterium]|nr:MAG: flagellar hook protein FlgE [Acidobacteriota bacterium]
MAVGSFSAGLSGLNANAMQLQVIGNNLANVNTVGFKSSAVTFMDLVSQTSQGPGGNPMQVGLGVAVGSISPVFSQGSIENTQESTNAAIQGEGFFVVSGSGGVSYTRAGNFSFDNTGALVTADGCRVQGYTAIDPATGGILTTGQPVDIVVSPSALRAPTPTSTLRTVTNLNASAPVGAVFNTSVQITDALGATHLMSVAYTKTGANTWTYAASVPGADVPGGTAGVPFPIPGASGTLTFGADGRLSAIDGAAPADRTISTPAWANGAAANVISWDLVDPNGARALTSYASASATSTVSQNGSAAGTVQNIAITADGTILATGQDGKALAIAKIALATFSNPKGLVKLGSNRYGESLASGIANVGPAETGGRGTLIGSALEQSNVDLAREFTQMILAQRGYQANSKSITVSDELLVETLNLKR